jgi:hypothetical protein
MLQQKVGKKCTKCNNGKNGKKHQVQIKMDNDGCSWMKFIDDDVGSGDVGNVSDNVGDVIHET